MAPEFFTGNYLSERPAAMPPAEAASEARHARLVQTGAKVVSHGRHVAVQLAEAAAFQLTG